jgi:hypothetical protein
MTNRGEYAELSFLVIPAHEPESSHAGACTHTAGYYENKGQDKYFGFFVFRLVGRNSAGYLTGFHA